MLHQKGVSGWVFLLVCFETVSTFWLGIPKKQIQINDLLRYYVWMHLPESKNKFSSTIKASKMRSKTSLNRERTASELSDFNKTAKPLVSVWRIIPFN